MIEVVEVIVDVPTMQTDQPFTYLVPEDVEVKVGMRVEVPFGRGDRHVQGFVVGCKEGPVATITENGVPLKKLVRVLDLAPVLNPELLALADYMKEQNFAFKISCLQTMLPSVMKAEYRKYVYFTDSHHPLKEELFAGKEELLWEEAETAGLLSQLMKLRSQGEVDIRYEVKKKNKVKTERYVTSLLTEEASRATAVASIPKNAKQQLALVEKLAEQKGKQSVKSLKEAGFSLAVLNRGAEKGWLQFEEVEAYRDPFKNSYFEKSYSLNLNQEQATAVEAITTAVDNQATTTFLLEGVTGSGKTEVYLQAIGEVLKQGKTAMMLVPEIALTPQMVSRFKGRFGEAVAVLHSGLSQGEKYDEWRKIERQEAKVVVGARSAVFAPLDNLGLLIIDEEHETTYKQEEAPRYHARDLAIWRGRYHQCPVVLGSATPSLESRARAQKGVYQLLRLTQRAQSAAQLPKIEIVDLREEYQQHNTSEFSLRLQELIEDRLAKKEQIVLLLNRRGFSSFVMCRDCGFVLPCPNCDISLTLHMDTKSMRCHYCGHEEGIPQRCPECGGGKIRYYGTGTQKVEAALLERFPKARVLRMDVDTTRKKGAHERLLKQFETGEADILLGTQMIAKGLDYPNVTLVGVLNADTALNLPDFRASERTFQLLTQVSGRAGRGEKPGEVVIQTFNPEHYAIQLAQTQDFERFYQKEMQLRHQSGYPPYYYTVKLTISHPEELQAAKKSLQLSELLKGQLTEASQLLGPSPSSIARVKQRYYYQIIIKYKHEANLQACLAEILQMSQVDQRQGLQIAIDNEPMYFI